jgi:hypothetical protein
MEKSPVLLRTILFALLILTAGQAFPQGKFEISAGAGWPEMTNLKIKYGKVLQIGACQSFSIESLSPDYKNKIYMDATAAEIYYHFGGKSKYNEQPVWYLLFGLGSLWGHDGDKNSYYFYPRVGRSFSFSKRIGINLDAGAFFPIGRESGDFFDFFVYPSGSISFFVRL